MQKGAQAIARSGTCTSPSKQVIVCSSTARFSQNGMWGSANRCMYKQKRLYTIVQCMIHAVEVKNPVAM